MDAAIAQAAGLLRQAKNIVALTGAGISVASGIPDFRSPGGLWERHDPMAVATAEALDRHPGRVWAFLLDVLSVVGAARPNPGHAALARLEAAGRLSAVITQNIDGLHQAAGSRNVVEFHGGMGRYYCMGCGREYDRAGAMRLTPAAVPWRCEACRGVVRPDIVFFGEAIPLDALGKSGQLALAADCIVVAGDIGGGRPGQSPAAGDQGPGRGGRGNQSDGKRLQGSGRRLDCRPGGSRPAGPGRPRAFTTCYISHRWVAMDALTPHGGFWAMMASATPTVIFVLSILAFMSLG